MKDRSLELRIEFLNKKPGCFSQPGFFYNVILLFQYISKNNCQLFAINYKLLTVNRKLVNLWHILEELLDFFITHRIIVQIAIDKAIVRRHIDKTMT